MGMRSEFSTLQAGRQAGSTAHGSAAWPTCRQQLSDALLTAAHGGQVESCALIVVLLIHVEPAPLLQAAAQASGVASAGVAVQRGAAGICTGGREERQVAARRKQPANC